MDLSEQFITHLIEKVLENKKEELTSLERDLSKLEKIKSPFPRVSYDEAAEILKGKSETFEYGSDFGGTDETLLSEHYDQPIFVHRFPANIKAFYMKPDPERADLSLSVDLIAPEGYGEIIGGGQREEELEPLLAKLKEHNLRQEDFDWYLDLRRFGSVPHAGFGLGIERMLSWICGLSHLREAIAFPRMINRLKP